MVGMWEEFKFKHNQNHKENTDYHETDITILSC